MEFILASGSPRRRQLLEQIGLRDFTVRPTDADESLPAGIHPGEAVERLSARKGMAARLQAGPEALILAADTVVALDGAILGKPGGREEAVSMLTALSGRTHQVYTGVTLIRGEEILTEHEVTAVTFRPLAAAEIDAYVQSGEPMDKAGAYGIQGLGALLAERLEGDYFNVMGMPLCRLGRMLARFGLDLLAGSPLEETT
ncbi:MAG TPA: septum formation protein Maf [Candidatus Intestinimonas stercorigallinarum]|nr:septum formation protein Maf [Candidatus Intestinimonas stercorigallinarum]